MGEAKFKQYSRIEFLKRHPRCVYCGAAATTTDHCPPRCFFAGRRWPETYEFPACKPCNEEARLDEQALGVLVRIRPMNDGEISEDADWKRLIEGVRNNQPMIIDEWMTMSGSRRKRFYRENFGKLGDDMREAGWQVANIGPLTRSAIDRFMVKIAKCLYYKYNSSLLSGAVFAQHVSIYSVKNLNKYMEALLSIAPMQALPKRSNESLVDQFIYRFNFSPEHKVLYAVVRFSEQFIFQITAMGDDMLARFEKDQREMPPMKKTMCVIASA